MTVSGVPSEARCVYLAQVLNSDLSMKLASPCQGRSESDTVYNSHKDANL